MVNEVIRDDFEHRQHFYLMGTLAKPYWIEISLVQYENNTLKSPQHDRKTNV